ncbi:MAG: UDP-galactopyranose mutase [Bacilli bacterium]|nr:UDP-galactopyranose mutase [Bacilli bacterium]
MKKHYDYLIVGSGISGSTMARLLSDAGKTVLVVEKRDEVGGNVHTDLIDGIPVHTYGPHIFHTHSKEAWDFFCKYADVAPYVNRVFANYKGKLISMPFNMHTFEALFGVKTPEEAKEVIGKEIEKEGIKEPKNLEEQALSLVGRTIYETLIKGYTEKQWGRDATELPASIIKRLPIRYEYNDNYFNDAYQGEPKGGYTPFIENLLKGVDVITGVDYLANKEEYDEKADEVIYTGRLDEYFGFELGHLEWRSLRFDVKKEEVDSFQCTAVVNYTEREVPYTRVSEHKKFDPSCTNHHSTILSYEYPDSFEEGKIPYYVVNDAKNSTLANKYKEKVAALNNVYFLGRLANYQYYDMDDAILSAFELYKELTK